MHPPNGMMKHAAAQLGIVRVRRWGEARRPWAGHPIWVMIIIAASRKLSDSVNSHV